MGESPLMHGFSDTEPVYAKVSWAATEVPLLSLNPTQYGLQAEIAVQGGRDRYFVPWGEVTYLKQHIPTDTTSVAPTVTPLK